MRDLMMSA
ncbi:unnamed protein product, partial [Cuscuta epithymum]